MREETVSRQELIWIFLGVVVAGAAALLISWFPTKDVVIEIVDHRWKWSIEVERYTAVRYSRQYGYAPNEAYNINEWTESEPVYYPDGRLRTTTHNYYCSYTLDEWVHHRWLVAEGLGIEPCWPATDGVRLMPAGAPLSPRDGWERLGDQDQQFFVLAKEVDGDREWESEVDTSTKWLGLKKGQVCIGEVNYFGYLRRIRSASQE